MQRWGDDDSSSSDDDQVVILPSISTTREPSLSSKQETPRISNTTSVQRPRQTPSATHQRSYQQRSSPHQHGQRGGRTSPPHHKQQQHRQQPQQNRQQDWKAQAKKDSSFYKDPQKVSGADWMANRRAKQEEEREQKHQQQRQQRKSQVQALQAAVSSLQQESVNVTAKQSQHHHSSRKPAPEPKQWERAQPKSWERGSPAPSTTSTKSSLQVHAEKLPSGGVRIMRREAGANSARSDSQSHKKQAQQEEAPDDEQNQDQKRKKKKGRGDTWERAPRGGGRGPGRGGGGRGSGDMGGRGGGRGKSGRDGGGRGRDGGGRGGGRDNSGRGRGGNSKKNNPKADIQVSEDKESQTKPQGQTREHNGVAVKGLVAGARQAIYARLQAQKEEEERVERISPRHAGSKKPGFSIPNVTSRFSFRSSFQPRKSSLAAAASESASKSPLNSSSHKNEPAYSAPSKKSSLAAACDTMTSTELASKSLSHSSSNRSGSSLASAAKNETSNTTPQHFSPMPERKVTNAKPHQFSPMSERKMTTFVPPKTKPNPTATASSFDPRETRLWPSPLHTSRVSPLPSPQGPSRSKVLTSGPEVKQSSAPATHTKTPTEAYAYGSSTRTTLPNFTRSTSQRSSLKVATVQPQATTNSPPGTKRTQASDLSDAQSPLLEKKSGAPPQKSSLALAAASSSKDSGSISVPPSAKKSSLAATAAARKEDAVLRMGATLSSRRGFVLAAARNSEGLSRTASGRAVKAVVRQVPQVDSTSTTSPPPSPPDISGNTNSAFEPVSGTLRQSPSIGARSTSAFDPINTNARPKSSPPVRKEDTEFRTIDADVVIADDAMKSGLTVKTKNHSSSVSRQAGSHHRKPSSLIGVTENGKKMSSLAAAAAIPSELQPVMDSERVARDAAILQNAGLLTGAEKSSRLAAKAGHRRRQSQADILLAARQPTSDLAATAAEFTPSFLTVGKSEEKLSSSGSSKLSMEPVYSLDSAQSSAKPKRLSDLVVATDTIAKDFALPENGVNSSATSAESKFDDPLGQSWQVAGGHDGSDMLGTTSSKTGKASVKGNSSLAIAAEKAFKESANGSALPSNSAIDRHPSGHRRMLSSLSAAASQSSQKDRKRGSSLAAAASRADPPADEAKTAVTRPASKKGPNLAGTSWQDSDTSGSTLPLIPATDDLTPNSGSRLALAAREDMNPNNSSWEPRRSSLALAAKSEPIRDSTLIKPSTDTTCEIEPPVYIDEKNNRPPVLDILGATWEQEDQAREQSPAQETTAVKPPLSPQSKRPPVGPRPAQKASDQNMTVYESYVASQPSAPPPPPNYPKQKKKLRGPTARAPYKGKRVLNGPAKAHASRIEIG